MSDAGLRRAEEVAVALLSVAACVGFVRLFDGTDFLPALLAAALVTHAIAAITRQRGWGLLPAAGAVLVGLVALTSWTWYAATTTLGLPTGATLGAVSDDLADAWSLFQEVVAPADPARGFVLVAAAAVAFAAYLADWAAFRVRSPLEAIAPTTILFVFGALLGADQHRVSVAVLYASAVLGYLVVHRVGIARRSGRWQQGDGPRGAGALLRAGALVAALAVALAGAVGPQLPGADDPALLTWHGVTEQPGSRVTVSPLVDIRSRLVQQADVEVFTVRTDERAYWRLTSLDTFDGTIWKSGGRYGEVDEALPTELDEDVAVDVVEQRFDIGALHQLWLPAAYEPRRIDAAGIGVRYESASGTLIVDTALADSDGLAYEVTSALPRFDPVALAAADPAEVPEDLAERYLQLPADLSATAVELARTTTEAFDDPYGKARALQDLFREGFTYDLDVQPGHGEPAIERFLRERRGYCEQFAGTYAAMARSLGIPARVAVGFTPGEADPDDAGLLRVRGEHAHAWPEVWLAGAGWVAMEPTPGRGAPGAEAWTGAREQQDTSGPSVTPTTVAGDVPPPTDDPDTSAPITAPPATTEVETGSQPRPAPAPAPSSGIALGRGATTLVLLALCLAVAWAVLVPAALLARRVHRRRAAADAGARALVTWDEVQAALGDAGAVRHPSETHQELAVRAQHLIGAPGEALRTLARVADLADYAGGCSDDDLAAAMAAAREVLDHLATRRPVSRRAAVWLDPRPLLPAGARRTIGTRATDER